jgi:hypothetical protein
MAAYDPIRETQQFEAMRDALRRAITPEPAAQGEKRRRHTTRRRTPARGTR